MFEGRNYVYEVYKESSFSKAAKNLYISQPSLSACVKKEEERLGVKLFNRNTSPIQLTPPGIEYIRSVEKIMEIEDDFQKYINDFQELHIGTLSIGSNNIYTSFLLPQIIKEFHEYYPNVSITLTEGNTVAELFDAMMNNNLDIAIDNFPTSYDLCTQRYLFTETLLLAVPRKYEINSKLSAYQLSYEDILASGSNFKSMPAVDFKYFNDIPFIVLKKGSDSRNRFDSAIARNKMNPVIELELDQSASSYFVAYNGLGATFVSNTLIINLKQHDQLCFYRVDEPEFIRDVYFYTKKNKYLSRSITEFFKIAVNSKAIKLEQQGMINSSFPISKDR